MKTLPWKLNEKPVERVTLSALTASLGAKGAGYLGAFWALVIEEGQGERKVTLVPEFTIPETPLPLGTVVFSALTGNGRAVMMACAEDPAVGRLVDRFVVEAKAPYKSARLAPIVGSAWFEYRKGQPNPLLHEAPSGPLLSYTDDCEAVRLLIDADRRLQAYAGR